MVVVNTVHQQNNILPRQQKPQSSPLRLDGLTMIGQRVTNFGKICKKVW
jgi:hypothetical protein